MFLPVKKLSIPVHRARAKTRYITANVTEVYDVIPSYVLLSFCHSMIYRFGVLPATYYTTDAVYSIIHRNKNNVNSPIADSMIFENVKVKFKTYMK